MKVHFYYLCLWHTSVSSNIAKTQQCYFCFFVTSVAFSVAFLCYFLKGYLLIKRQL